MKLVVGLGNPGKKYEGTRHNAGYEVLAAVARRLGVSGAKAKFDGELAEAYHEGQRVLLLSPLTYMNRSGRSVSQASHFFGIENRDILIVCDDFQLSVSRLRIRPSGSSGGQKGLQDVIQQCGSDVPRLRVGIGPVPPQWDVADFVLSRFTAEERKEMDKVVGRAAQAVLDWLSRGMEYCMNQYNGPGAEGIA